MNKVGKVFVATLLALTGTAAQAGTVVCGGTIEVLNFDSTNAGGGTLSIKLSTMNTTVYFCDTESAFTAPGNSYSIAPSTCRTMYATFLAAKASGQSLSNVYFDGSSVPTSCSGWTAWQAANIRHYEY